MFFMQGGSDRLDLTGCEGDFRLKSINVLTGQWGETTTIVGGKKVKISTPGDGSWLLVIVPAK
ncbi:MAG: hypothetical protein KAJ46_01390 [Sedimentisphaerales bacterium]|nr:hypothetical protein [Sedimentisphaerales bacterium]